MVHFENHVKSSHESAFEHNRVFSLIPNAEHRRLFKYGPVYSAWVFGISDLNLFWFLIAGFTCFTVGVYYKSVLALYYLL
jgi:hypothetical protein